MSNSIFGKSEIRESKGAGTLWEVSRLLKTSNIWLVFQTNDRGEKITQFTFYHVNLLTTARSSDPWWLYDVIKAGRSAFLKEIAEKEYWHTN